MITTTRSLGLAGFGWALAYLPVHLYWAFGGLSTPIGVDESSEGFRVTNFGASLVILGAGLVCLSLTTRWGARLPGALRRGAAWVGGGFALLHWTAYTTIGVLRLGGVIGYPHDDTTTATQLRNFDWWNLGYFELWFGVMGLLLIACARRNKALERVRGRRPLTRRDRAGIATALAGVASVVWGVFTFAPVVFACLGPALVGAGLLVLVHQHSDRSFA